MTERKFRILRTEDVFTLAFLRINPPISRAGPLWVECLMTDEEYAGFQRSLNQEDETCERI